MISALRISTVQQNVVRVFPSSAKAVGFDGKGCSPQMVTKAPTFQGFEKPEENVERWPLPEKKKSRRKKKFTGSENVGGDYLPL